MSAFLNLRRKLFGKPLDPLDKKTHRANRHFERYLTPAASARARFAL
jgi:hypothetical protein